MARLQEIEKIIDDYEKVLRKLDRVTILDENKKERILDFNINNVKSFLIDFFYYNHLYNSENGMKPFAKTSQSKPGTEVVEYTNCGQRRTAGDLFRLALKYYSEAVTLYEVMEALFHITNNRTSNRICYKSDSNKYGVVYMNVCSTIHRRVFNIKLGDYTQYKFDNNNSYSIQTHDLQEEFPILGTDYNLLFDTKDGKELVEKKKNKTTLFAIPNNMTQSDLDKLVIAKLKKLKKIA